MTDAIDVTTMPGTSLWVGSEGAIHVRENGAVIRMVTAEQASDFARALAEAAARSDGGVPAPDQPDLAAEADRLRSEVAHLDAWEDVHIEALANAHSRIAQLESGLRELRTRLAPRVNGVGSATVEVLVCEIDAALADGARSKEQP